MRLIKLDSVDSTNSYLNGLGSAATHGTVVMAIEQTSGRGQRGNSWEAEPGANVTLSMLLRPDGLEASRQFIISQAVSLAIVETLDHILPGHGVSIKWPNDIYVDDRKICGILIENVLTGREIARSTVGIGLNVNQAVFCSDAPNPVSLYQLTGEKRDVETVALEMSRCILDRVAEALASSRGAEGIAWRYFSRLYRREGWHRYRDNLRGVDMTARIDSVAPSGHITLTDRDDLRQYTYAFKEITFILS